MNIKDLGIKEFSLPNQQLEQFSPCDDAGVSTSGTQYSLTDLSKYWTPGVWQGALLIMDIQGQIYVTIVNSNTQQTLIFPTFPSITRVTKSSYVLKRLPPSLVRPGINLTGTQQLVTGLYNATLLINPLLNGALFSTYALPPVGTNSSVASPNVMQDLAATWLPNAYRGQRIYNLTDGSRGTIIANTANTVTSTPLTGGFTNLWQNTNRYAFAGVVVDVTDGLQYLPVPVGYTARIIEVFMAFNQPIQLFYNTDNIYFYHGVCIPTTGGTVEDIPVASPTDSRLLDPTASSAHQIIVDAINLGNGYASGSLQLTGIREQLLPSI